MAGAAANGFQHEVQAQEAAALQTEAPSPTPQQVTLADLRAVRPADVAADDPGADAVCCACYYGMFQGDAAGNFRPDELVDRGTVAAVLQRLSGQEAPDYDDRFPDVAAGDWCAPGAAWAAEQGVVQGDADGNFAPTRQVTRAELAVMLQRYAALMGRAAESPEGLDGFWDEEDVPDYARAALSWSVDSGVFRGILGNYILPGFPVSRAQLAQALVCLSALDPEAEPVVVQCAESCQARAASGVSLARREAIQAAMDEAAKKYHAVGIQVTVVENGEVAASFAGGWATRPGKSSYASAEDYRYLVEAGDIAEASASQDAEYQMEVQEAEPQDGSDPQAAEYRVAARNADFSNDPDPQVVVKRVKGGDPMTTAHKERVASISKVVVGMAAMALAEDGVIDLDESIGKYWDCVVKSSRYPNDPISVNTILTHTSTIPMGGNSYTYSAVRRCLSSAGSGKPGSMSSWGYNNYAFEALGMTLELASGQLIDDVLDQQFFDLLDIDAAFRADQLEDKDKLVTIYQGSSVGRTIQRHLSAGAGVTKPGSSGGVFCGNLTVSARDMAKLVAVLAGDGLYEGIRLLDKESVAHMEEQLGTTEKGFEQCYPLRHQSEMYGRDDIYYHTGSAWGVYNCMSYDPATGDGVVVLTSGASSQWDRYGVYAVCGEINQMVYDLLDTFS